MGGPVGFEVDVALGELGADEIVQVFGFAGDPCQLVFDLTAEGRGAAVCDQGRTVRIDSRYFTTFTYFCGVFDD